MGYAFLVVTILLLGVIGILIYFIMKDKASQKSLESLNKETSKVQNNLDVLVDHQEKVNVIKKDYDSTKEEIKKETNEKETQNIIANIISNNNSKLRK